jgi:Sel1 repeat
MLDALMWRRLKWTIAVLIALGAVVTADIAHAEPRSENGNIKSIINRKQPGDRLLPQTDDRPLRGPCDALESNWPCQPTPHTPYLRERAHQRALQEAQRALQEAQRALQEAFRSCVQADQPAADGDGVNKEKGCAFEYLRNLTNAHRDSQGTPQARFVANAFVALGQYYLEGIPGTVKADAQMAHEMFHYAASYFADPEAQYHLGRLYLLGKGSVKDPMLAARWLRLAANKGEHRAQALLGALLFKGEEVPRQAALGLFWLDVAKDSAGPDEGWITETYASAFAQATDGERMLARKYLENWLKRPPSP